MTHSGLLVGTPGYMAPEQAGGRRALVGPATDVYALGVVLYQLITGRLPFQDEAVLELLRAVAFDEPPRPRRLRPGLARDLEAITLRCLEKDPGRRYPTAQALADDLRSFREGRPVLARPVGSAARLARAGRRRPLVAALLSLLAVSLVGGMGGVAWQWREANRQRDLADAHARRAEVEKQSALYQGYRASMAAAGAALEDHDVADAARHLDSAPEALRGWEWRHLHAGLDDSSRRIALPAEGGCLIAAPDRLQVGVRTAAGLHITDLDGGDPRTVPIARGPTVRLDVAGTRRGLRLAVRAGDAALDLLDESGKALRRVALPGEEYPDLVVFSPDGARLACLIGRKRRRVAVFDADSGAQTATCEGHDDAIWAISFSPDGSRLATGGEDRTARLWDAATGAMLAACRGHEGKVLAAAFSPDGARLATASADGTVRQWDAGTGREVEPPYDRHPSQVYASVYSPDGEWIASAGGDRTVRVWRARGRQDLAVLHGHTANVTELAFAPDGRRLASFSRDSPVIGAGDDSVRAWDVDPNAAMNVLNEHAKTVYPVAYSPDGRRLASGSWDGTARLWDADTGELCATLPHPGPVRCLAFSPDGSGLATGCGQDDRIRIWDATTARVRDEVPFQAGDLLALAFSPDGTKMAATQHDPRPNVRRLAVLDVASGREVFSTQASSPKGPPLDQFLLAYSPDGRWLAVPGDDDKTVLLLDARTHQTARRLEGHESDVHKAAFSPDGRELATCSRDHTVRLWRTDRAGCRVLRGHTEEVYALAYHPDGTRLATAGQDGAIWLWDVKRGVDVARMSGHKSFVWSLAFRPSGATLASGSGDCTVRLWDTMPLKERHRVRREAAALRPEADRLVDRLWDERGGPAAVVERLRSGPMASEALRRAAFLAVLRRSAGSPE